MQLRLKRARLWQHGMRALRCAPCYQFCGRQGSGSVTLDSQATKLQFNSGAALQPWLRMANDSCGPLGLAASMSRMKRACQQCKTSQSPHGVRMLDKTSCCRWRGLLPATL